MGGRSLHNGSRGGRRHSAYVGSIEPDITTHVAAARQVRRLLRVGMGASNECGARPPRTCVMASRAPCGQQCVARLGRDERRGVGTHQVRFHNIRPSAAVVEYRVHREHVLGDGKPAGTGRASDAMARLQIDMPRGVKLTWEAWSHPHSARGRATPRAFHRAPRLRSCCSCSRLATCWHRIPWSAR